MLSDSSLKEISLIFCGDEDEFYCYKTGPKLVRFFNEYYKKDDKYGQGFPTRWAYVYDNLIALYNANRLDSFFNIILSKEYLVKDLNISPVEAMEKSKMILDKFNSIIDIDAYSISFSNGKYHLIEQNKDLVFLGEGGFANVYRQKSTGLVVKILKDDFLMDRGIRSRFKREYTITKSLQDANGIIRVYDFNERNCSYSMELAELTLQEYILNGGITDAIRVNCIRQILIIMSEVHKRDIIHRDLSPSNVFIISGALKIADFGLGKDLNMFTSHQTVHTNSLGQYYYCAPEQFMMLKDSDKRSDVYSLGRLVNFIMTGDPRNSNHLFRSVSEKATNQDMSYRYADAQTFLLYFEKSLKFHNDEENEKTILGKMKSGVYDEDVENYIYELSSNDISEKLHLGVNGFANCLLKFMKCSDDQAQHVIQSIDQTYGDVCYRFEDYDTFASFSSEILMDDFPFTVKEIAANMLNCIAYSVGRFMAQHLIDDVISYGVEPLLEDILLTK